MIRIVADSELPRKLTEICEPAEVVDGAGTIVGRFLPESISRRWVPVGPEPTAEELKRAAEESEEYSTAEVLAYLESLPRTGSDGNGRPGTS
jgi:hypothetical protein